jgi:putative DNA primase/helicase
VSLRPIVNAFGGDLYQGGARASVPAPGHSAADRSISLILSDERVIIHSFGAADWRDVRDALRRRGLIDAVGRPLGAGSAGETSRPDIRQRLETAAHLWAGGRTATGTGRASHYLRRRGVAWRDDLTDLRDHPAAPVSIYGRSRQTRAALMARISDVSGALTGVELTYLDPNGAQAAGLMVSRKAVGRIPPGSAVRLMAVGSRMLVSEGVITTLSAARRFERPGWALLSASNLARWSPPTGVRDVLIAADNGAAGEDAALRLKIRLRHLGLTVAVVRPPNGIGDWNEADQGLIRAKEREEGRGGAPVRRG